MHEYSIYKKKGVKLHQSIHSTVRTIVLESKSTKKNSTTPFYILAVSITCSFDRLFNNEKVAKMKKGDAGGSEKP